MAINKCGACGGSGREPSYFAGMGGGKCGRCGGSGREPGSVARGFQADAAGGQAIDCSAKLEMPLEGWSIEPGDQIVSAVRGSISTADLANLAGLHWVDGQKGGVLIGRDLKEALEGRPVMTAHVLEWFLESPDRIPESWKQRHDMFFWGTIYRNRNGRPAVLCIRWYGSRVNWDYRPLVGRWYNDDPAVVLAGDC